LVVVIMMLWLMPNGLRRVMSRMVIMKIISLLVVHRMNQFPRRPTNVHALVQRDGPPVPALAGKLHRVARGHGLNFARVGPQSRAHAVAVLAAHGYGYDLDGVVERGTASCFVLGAAAELFLGDRAVWIAADFTPFGGCCFR